MRNKFQYADKRIDHRTTMFKNFKFTTPITFEFTPDKESNQVNMFEKYKTIFIDMKNIDPNIEVITILEHISNTKENSHLEFNILKTYIHKFTQTTSSRSIYIARLNNR